jgi:hypothetical protein
MLPGQQFWSCDWAAECKGLPRVNGHSFVSGFHSFMDWLQLLLQQ